MEISQNIPNYGSNCPDNGSSSPGSLPLPQLNATDRVTSTAEGDNLPAVSRPHLTSSSGFSTISTPRIPKTRTTNISSLDTNSTILDRQRIWQPLPYTACVPPKMPTPCGATFGGLSYLSKSDHWSKFHVVEREGHMIKAENISDLKILDNSETSIEVSSTLFPPELAEIRS